MTSCCQAATEDSLDTQPTDPAARTVTPVAGHRGSTELCAGNDNIDHAAALGVGTIVEPGGSTRADDVTASAKEHGIDLIDAGLRLFHH